MDGFSSYHNNSGNNTKEPDFNMLTQIGSSIQKISQNVSSMQRMVQHLGTTQDSREFRAQLEQIQQYTQQLAKDTSSNLRKVNAISSSSLTTSEQRQWRAQKDRLTDEFTTTLNAFQAVQRSVAAKQRDQIQKSRALHMGNHISGPPGSKSQSQALIELQDESQMSSLEKQRQFKQKQQQLQNDEIDLEMLEEQERSIRILESDINDVKQIFKDLGTLVHEQGELVDSIEASVERTEVFVQEGTQQLRQASNYQIKLKKKKFILAMIAAAILAIIIGIIAWQTSS